MEEDNDSKILVEEFKKDYAKQQFSDEEKEQYWYNYCASQIRTYSELIGDADDSISRIFYLEIKEVEPKVAKYLARVISDYKLNRFKLLRRGIFLPVFYSFFM